jgi:DNA-binding PadR family transcriptional regulator
MSRIDLLQGTLGMLILRALQWGPQHGYGISQAIRTQSSEVLLRWKRARCTRPVHRLEKQGWVRTGSGGRPRPTSAPSTTASTPAGKKQLIEEHARWKQMVQAIGNIMDTTPAKEHT